MVLISHSDPQGTEMVPCISQSLCCLLWEAQGMWWMEFSSFPLKEVIWLPGADGLIPSQIPISGRRDIKVTYLDASGLKG